MLKVGVALRSNFVRARDDKAFLVGYRWNPAKRLHHQNIVRFIDTVTVSGRAAILMEKAATAPSPSACVATTRPLSI